MDLVQTCGFIIDIKQALKWILLISSFHGTICGHKALPSIQDSIRPCSSNHQCIQSIGEICWWSYDGCSHGQCMCDPRSHYFTDLGKCGHVKLGGQQCRSGDSCPLRMECKSGRCTCQKGTRMTDDSRFCLKERERMFGETCNIETDVCYLNMATGYHTSLVTCINKKCRCKSGYKPEGGTCRKLMILEGYCDQNHHCQGGALCKGKLCICPPGYFPGAGNTKCIKAGAQFDLGLGAECDEVNEQRYCALGLVCHQCPRDSHYTCVAYRKSETYNSAFIGSGHQNSPTVFCLLFTFLSSTFSILKISHWL